MKTHIKNLFLLPALIAGLSLARTGPATAQTFRTLHSFTNSPDGANPWAGLVLAGNALYGTAWGGGSSGKGMVFRVNTDGTGFTNLHSLNGGSDGAVPVAGLLLSGSTLYGTANGGGGSGGGTVFKINTNGTGFAALYSVTGVQYPYGSLVLSDGILYGTAEIGSANYGAVFFAAGATGFTSNLYVFQGGTDGAEPFAGLVASNNTLYGTASTHGTNGNGTVFAVGTDGFGFRILHGFSERDRTYSTNSDGARPLAGLILSGDTAYGTASEGGSSAYGTVFAVNTQTTGFTNLHNFTNSDGARPRAGLVLSGNTLYGTTSQGGSSGNGTIFKVNTDGTGFTTLYSFTALDPTYSTNSDGTAPRAGLVLSGNTLYGTTYGGGSSGLGTVFSLSLPQPPQLAIAPSGTNVILTWPTNSTGFTLQSTTNLASPALWTNVPPGAVVVNGQNAVTNPISGTQKFYRLSQ